MKDALINSCLKDRNAILAPWNAEVLPSEKQKYAIFMDLSFGIAV